MPQAHFDFTSLTVEERLELVEQIWESLAQRPEAVPLTAGQKAELDRRLEEMAHDGGEGIPWDKVLRQIRGRVE